MPMAIGGQASTICQKVSERPMPGQAVRFTTKVPIAQQKPALRPQNRPIGALA